LRLSQRFATGDGDMAGAEVGDLVEYRLQAPFTAAFKSVGGIAVAAAQWATCQPHEDGGQANGAGLSLQ